MQFTEDELPRKMQRLADLTNRINDMVVPLLTSDEPLQQDDWAQALQTTYEYNHELPDSSWAQHLMFLTMLRGISSLKHFIGTCTREEMEQKARRPERHVAHYWASHSAARKWITTISRNLIPNFTQEQRIELAIAFMDAYIVFLKRWQEFEGDTFTFRADTPDMTIDNIAEARFPLDAAARTSWKQWAASQFGVRQRVAE